MELGASGSQGEVRSPNGSDGNGTAETHEESETLSRGHVSLVLAIQSLLWQFSHPQIRADFMNGKFGPKLNPSILQRLDELKWSLFPRWLGGPEYSMETYKKASVHVYKLVNKDEGLFLSDIDAMDDCMSYKDWFATLAELARNNYWNRIPPEERCVHIQEEERLGRNGSRKDSDGSSGFSPERAQKTLRVKVEPKQRSARRTRVEEITISSSEESEDSDPRGRGDTSSSDSSQASTPRKKHNGRGGRKKVVTPPKFSLNGKMNLESYLRIFEDYFHKKYNGNGYDQCQLLAEFLEGELLEIYEIRGGRQIKYTAMKKHLLEYFAKLKVGSKKFWRKKLEEAKCEKGESLDMYGMRLIGLAEPAYPSSSTECVSKLRQRYLDTIPADIAQQLKSAERALRATTNGKKKHMTFSAMMQMAKEVQKEKDSSVHSVMWTADSRPAGTTPAAPPREEPKQEPNRTPNQATSRGGQALWCSFCNKQTNHTRRNCWRANKACLICGNQNHLMEGCPRYRPRRNANTGQNLNGQASM